MVCFDEFQHENIRLLDHTHRLQRPLFSCLFEKKIPLRIFTLDDSLFGGKSNFTFPEEAKYAPDIENRVFINTVHCIKMSKDFPSVC